MNRVALMTVIAGLATGATALAYTYTGSAWSRRDLPVGYTVHRQLSTDTGDGAALAAIQNGHTTWDALECSVMQWQFAGRTNNSGWAVDDNENAVSWREQAWDDSGFALAITSSIFQVGGSLTDTDIKFNGANHQWAAFDNNPGGRDPRTDIESVATHETGHALGLDHTNVRGSTMLPSSGPGDISPRSLGQDDIAGACDLYPSGGNVPDAPDDPGPGPVGGTQDFGENCGPEAGCIGSLFCISDGQTAYCSDQCRLDGDCPDQYYCARLSDGGGACARGQSPVPGDVGGMGDECGQQSGCAQGLFCIQDGERTYCTGPCNGGECQPGYFCAGLQGGGTVCVQGEDPGSGPDLPDHGDRCGPNGECAANLFCLEDSQYRDERTGAAIPYCTGPCDGGQCPAGFFCADLGNGDNACAYEPQGLPGPDEPCGPQGECAQSLICLQDPNHVDETTGQMVPYCTTACQGGACPPGHVCVQLQSGGDACRIVPSAGPRRIGDQCWVNPEAPGADPSCGDDPTLICVNTRYANGEITDPGLCTRACDPQNCCPDGWGCIGEIQSGVCLRGVVDDPTPACAVEPVPGPVDPPPPGPDTPDPNLPPSPSGLPDGGVPGPGADPGEPMPPPGVVRHNDDDSGCRAVVGRDVPVTPVFAGLVLFGLLIRRRR